MIKITFEFPAIDNKPSIEKSMPAVPREGEAVYYGNIVLYVRNVNYDISKGKILVRLKHP